MCRIRRLSAKNRDQYRWKRRLTVASLVAIRVAMVNRALFGPIGSAAHGELTYFNLVRCSELRALPTVAPF